jgi:two-component system, response regulator PdtaR
MTTHSTRAVLVVEDEPLIGLDLQYLLEEAGYKVVGPATTVAEALQLIHDHALRAALVDLNLGSESSENVLTQLKALSVPVVLLTGYSTRTQAPPFDTSPTVRKPYESRHLLQVLEYVVDNPGVMPPSLSSGHVSRAP